MKPKILVLGSSNTDMIIRLDRIPKPGETVLGGAFATAAGGKGANQAVAAARAGGAVTFMARIGRDMFGDQALAGLARAGINVAHVSRDRSAPSGVALIFVARSGQNSIAVAGGANARLSPAALARAGAALQEAQMLVLQLESPLKTVLAAARLAKRAGVPVILNPAPAQPLPDELLHCVNILTPNETEAELLTGTQVNSAAAASRAAAKLLQRGVETVIITLGARGALVATLAGQQIVPGFKVKPVDTTAAGDVFNGALAVALAEGQPLPEAVRFANAAGALSVTKLGAQPSAPRRSEIEQLLRAQA
jgi:ribokinase